MGQFMIRNREFIDNTVSLCMIVKDEADLILNCLHSVRSLVQEIIVVDTGSTDNTKELALEHGAKVFAFTWQGDFATARNYSLQQAKGAWILILDADEILEPVSREEFSRLLSDPNVEGYFIQIHNYLDENGTNPLKTTDQAVRLFRNKPAYRFAGAIHEQVAPAILLANNNQGLATAPLVINHYGYLKSQIRQKNKFQRNTEIIAKEMAKDPNNPFLPYCLGLEFYQHNRINEGLGYLEKALKKAQGSEGFFEDLILSVAAGYLMTAQFNKLIGFIDQALLMFPKQANFFLFRGLAHFCLEHYCHAATDFSRATLLSWPDPVCVSESLNFLLLSLASCKERNTDILTPYCAIAIREIQMFIFSINQGFDTVHFPAQIRLKRLLEEIISVFTAFQED